MKPVLINKKWFDAHNYRKTTGKNDCRNCVYSSCEINEIFCHCEHVDIGLPVSKQRICDAWMNYKDIYSPSVK
jgi:hypothetical protein